MKTTRCDRCEADSKSAVAYSPGGPVGGQSQKERPGEITDGTLYQEKTARKVLLFDTSPPSERREGMKETKEKDGTGHGSAWGHRLYLTNP